jgi:hypothetical protein
MTDDFFMQQLKDARDRHKEVTLDLGGRTVYGLIVHLDDSFVKVRPSSGGSGVLYDAHTVKLENVIAITSK